MSEAPIIEPTTEKKPRLFGWVVAFALLIALLVMVGVGLKRAMLGTISKEEDVPDFVFTSFEGVEYRKAELAGKVIVLNFWASWCKPCEQEAADMQTAWEMYAPRGDVVFLGVDYVDTEPEAMKYIDKFDITYPNGPDLGTRISQAFRTRGVPETYVIDKEGNLVYIKIGPFQSLSEITRAIDPLLE